MLKDRLKISKSNKIIKGHITLSGSKSISNRVLIIQALCPDDFEIRGLASSKDTVTLKALLNSEKKRIRCRCSRNYLSFSDRIFGTN